MIHPTAIIHPNAKVSASVKVGPYSVIDEDVELGADCILGPHVYITGRTTIGVRNRFHAGSVIGDAPQDLKYANEHTGLRIGDDNIFREHVGVHRSNKLTEDTVIGSNCFFMQDAHIGHNCVIGNHVIIASGAVLGGHVTVFDRAFISGVCGVHQFVRVGTLSLMQGGTILSADLPPFTIAHQVNILCGLNIIGLRRAGFSAADRLELKQLYRALFRSGENLRSAVARAKEKFCGAAAKTMLEFVSESKRGVCADRGHRTAASGEDPAEM
jgi:UDP-N-acetylglucosamine acyltransferase